MNKALKKYKCHYKHTRYAKRLISKIKAIKAIKAMKAAHALINGTMMISQVSRLQVNSAVKSVTVADLQVKIGENVIMAMDSIKFPDWYKK